MRKSQSRTVLPKWSAALDVVFCPYNCLHNNPQSFFSGVNLTLKCVCLVTKQSEKRTAGNGSLIAYAHGLCLCLCWVLCEIQMKRKVFFILSTECYRLTIVSEDVPWNFSCSLWRCRSTISHTKCWSIVLSGLFKNSAINGQNNIPSIRDKGVSHCISNTSYLQFFISALSNISLCHSMCHSCSDGLAQENLLCLLIHWIGNNLILVYSFY